jgi:hypothetical protein
VTLEDQLGRVDALVAHLVDLAGHRDALRGLAEAGLLVDEEGCHVACRGWSPPRSVLHEHGDEVARSAIGQPHLLAVDGPTRRPSPRTALVRDRRDIGAKARLGHRERPADLPGRHLGQVALLLLLGAVLQDHVGHDEVGVDDAADRHPAARDLLHAQGVGEQGLAQAAVLLGDHQAEDPHLLHPLDDLLRVFVAVLQLGGDRDDLLVDELAEISLGRKPAAREVKALTTNPCDRTRGLPL